MKPGKKKKKLEIGSFFILNVEKIALVLVIPVAIFLAIQGTKYEPLTWQPDALTKAADSANTVIKASERKASDEEVSIITYDVKATWIKAKISSEYYRTETTWLPSLFPEKNKRGSVNVFTVNDLKAQSGLGAVTVNPAVRELTTGRRTPAPTTSNTSISSNDPTNNRTGERWAMVTGLIPVKQQLDLYVERFSSSVFPDPLRDMPMYVFYDVERAEIVPGKSELQWAKLDILPEFTKKKLLWTGSVIDPVDPSFIAPLIKFPMAYPLPPVTKTFGEEVAHPPLIPMLTESQMDVLQQIDKRNEKLRKEIFNVKPEDILQGDGLFGNSGRMDSGSMGMSSGESMSSGGSMGRDLPIRKKPRILGPGEVDEDEIKEAQVDNYLFRFLDFNVEPGKSYRYRVRLYLANPNFELQPNLLEDETLLKEPFLITEYSTPSNMVTIPLESRVLTTDVFATDARQPWLDPAASIMAVHFNLEDGSEWYVEKERVFRGSTINYRRQVAKNAEQEKKVTGSSMDSYDSPSASPGGRSPSPRNGSGRTTRPADAKKEEVKPIDIISDVCVLDMRGGEALYRGNSPLAQKSPDLKTPGRVMVLEPSGNILIRTVNSDLIEVEEVKNPKSPGTAGMGGSGYGGGGYDSNMP